MAEETSAAPVGGGESSASPSSAATAVSQVGSSASAAPGNAPGGGVDVRQGDPNATALGAVAEFQILNRKFKDQSEAERILGAEIGQKRNVQRENAQLKAQAAKFESELNGLRALIQGQEAQEQGVPGARDVSGQRSFPQELAESGELDLIAKMFGDPEMGPAHAMYRMAELLDQRSSKSLDQVREEIRGELTQERTLAYQHQAVAKAFGAVKSLAQTFPELDESNESEDAVAAQQGVFEILKDSFTPEQIATNPERCIRMAVVEYRNQNGTPVFAQQPGTSGSPSARAAMAAEAAANGAASSPIDGSGVPRQRPPGSPETLADRIRRENREVSKPIRAVGGKAMWTPL